MSYSIIGIISIVVHLIINRDILWHGGERTIVPAYREYRDYILGMLVFCVTDVLWGFLNEWHLIMPLYAVTVLFFMLINIWRHLRGILVKELLGTTGWRN